jgi:hypothetical protein
MQVAEEFMPFHAVANSFNFWGSMNEFVRQSEERIVAMIQFSKEEILLAGEGQHIFSRDVYQSDIESVRRDVLASMEMLEGPSGNSWTGTARNSRTLLLSSITMEEEEVFDYGFKGKDFGFTSLNVNTQDLGADPFENGNLLEVLGSSPSYYSVSSLDRSGAVVHGDVDPILVGPVFEYRISNKVADLNVDVSQHEEVIFNDEDVDFTITGLVSQHDVDLGLASGPAWHLIFEGKDYSIQNVFPDGTLSLKEVGSATLSPDWKLINGSTTEKEGSSGFKNVTGYGLVEINSPSGLDAREIIRVGDVVYLGWGSTPRIYKISSFQKDSNRFYIRDYSEGGLGSEDVKVYRRIIDKKVGQFGHDGLVIESDQDVQSLLGISNGVGHDPTDVDSTAIKENHIVFMDGEYYNISEVDGEILRISGPSREYGTSGISVEFNIYKFSKENLALSEKQKPPYDSKPNVHEFDKVDRSGGVILSGRDGQAGLVAISSVLNASEPLDIMSHDERIEYKIEYREENQ